MPEFVLPIDREDRVRLTAMVQYIFQSDRYSVSSIAGGPTVVFFAPDLIEPDAVRQVVIDGNTFACSNSEHVVSSGNTAIEALNRAIAFMESITVSALEKAELERRVQVVGAQLEDEIKREELSLTVLQVTATLLNELEEDEDAA